MSRVLTCRIVDSSVVWGLTTEVIGWRRFENQMQFCMMSLLSWSLGVDEGSDLVEEI